MPDGRAFNGGAELSRVLSQTESEALARTMIKHMLTFAIGRELTPDDRCEVDAIVEATRSGFLQNAAVAHERYGGFLLEQLKDSTEAAYQIRQSIERFEEWGAVRVAEELKARYSSLLASN